MVKKMNYYTVNVVIPVGFKMQVLADNADDAISLCEDKLDPDYVFVEYANDTCGIEVPYDSYDDDDNTSKFELTGIEYWGYAKYELDEYEKPIPEELTFSDVDAEDDEDEEEN